MRTKNLFIAAALMLAVNSGFAQSNSPGTMQIGLGWGLALGGATFSTDAPGSVDSKGVGGKANYGLRFQYGLAESFSAGIYLRSEAAVYAVDYTAPDGYGGTYTSSTDLTTSGIGVGVEAKYYIVNKDHFNFYAAVPIGYSSSKVTYSDFEDAGSTTYGGLSYGVGLGINWYFGDVFGINSDLGYTGSSLSHSFPADDPDPAYKGKISSGGLMFGLGIGVKFGGK